MLFTQLFESDFNKKPQLELEESTNNIGSQIKSVYQKIYDQGDDAIEFMYNDSPIFAQYWDEYEGDLDSIIAEVDPRELQVILDELESAAEDQNISEATDDDYEDCSYCSGTGEGRYEGSSCSHCGGSGVEPESDNDDVDPTEDDWYDDSEEPESYYEKSLRSRGLGEADAPIDTEWYRKQQERQTRAKQKQDRQQGVAEGSNDTIYPNAEVIKSKNGKPVGEIYQDGNEWGCFHYKADRGYDMIDSREDAIQALKDLHSETARHRPDYTIKGVAEAGVGNRMSDMSVGSPKIVYKNGRAVGEIGVDHDPSPGQGPFYMKHYETNTWYSGYDTKKEALDDLRHVVDQMNEGVGSDMAKLIGIPVVAGAAAIGAQHYDDQQPHVQIGGQNAKIVRYDSTRIPDTAMTLTGKDGKTYRVWQQSGKGMNKMTLAAPVEQVKEADKKKDDDEPEVRDVALQRAISRAKSDFPTAGSGLEALAKDFMRGQDQDQKTFDQLRQAERKQDQMLSQINRVDQEQEQEIQGLEKQNSGLASRLQQLQSVNSQLEKKLAAMSGKRAAKSAEKEPEASTPMTPAIGIKTTAPAEEPKAEPKSKATPKSNPVVKQLPAPAPGARAFGSMTPALAAAGNPQQSLFPSNYAQDSANMALQKVRQDAQDIDFKDVASVDKLRKLAQREIEPSNENKEPKPERPEADYGGEYQAMVNRVGQKAKEGSRKTVWDPVKRVYKTVPVNPVKEQEPSRAGYNAIKSVSDWAEKLRVMRELQKDMSLMTDPEAKAAVDQRIGDLMKVGIKQGYVK